MRIGIPRGFLYYTYRPFLDSFFSGLGVETRVSAKTDEEILEKGIAACVDEACLPAKLVCGQVEKLAETCDAVMLPRLMKTEFGESICPKIAGAADLIQGKAAREKLIFTEPLYLDDKKKLKKVLWKECRKLGIKKNRFTAGFLNGIAAQKQAKPGIRDEGFSCRIFLGGHPYNLYDPFVNMDLIQKLHRMDIGVVTADTVSREEKDNSLRYSDLIKQPYWSFFVDHFASLEILRRQGIDGIIYLSSFSCGTDAFTVEMLRKNLRGLPMLVLKLDEQRGEAGFDTRLEAFCEILKRRAAG